MRSGRIITLWMLMYKAAVISTAPYIYTHIFLLYFFFKNLSPLSLYTHKRLDDIIRQACYRHRRHIPGERHTHKTHTFHTISYRGEVLPRPHPVTHKLHTISYNIIHTTGQNLLL
jgi:hypothetical protein